MRIILVIYYFIDTILIIYYLAHHLSSLNIQLYNQIIDFVYILKFGILAAFMNCSARPHFGKLMSAV